MSDPLWLGGQCQHTSQFPNVGLANAKILGAITYRSGPEWEERFGRRRLSKRPSFGPDFEIEKYLEKVTQEALHRGHPNAYLYLTKAMDLYDLSRGYASLEESLARIKARTLVLGVQSDILIPIWQQQEVATRLKAAGNEEVTYYELDSIYGHDTFLLDVDNVGAAVKGHLESI
ncbi:hypothetical protein SARC_13647 [Sphaeroforma arctica JP610]|uniref:AB hydrolase-1 domain-containing protein n=1 Tax=Sphaeroforma arctica JP610 TaxID=667725 RepID=A0A0L0FBB7_9EUKA|nr:hypothetical protein SARC_13647 [Sphaeroforma arctica JP610]KNC73796.1 hypothetical protein SARC_13647 [Sphaeroforma arctica JP610]|eukprot:XP_014147698.1 hypothetical protein SARC_13647 [Sphaeroforma arctica JP610]